ncbi:MAG: hypothetical protein L0I76_25265 [Pseudonocardia sp.]|nr:hypothetical protein [Pseudonocardia sp.]
MRPLFARTPREQPTGPLTGWKLAYPMLSVDGGTAGFSGVTLGRAHVYRWVDDALCAHGCRHECPSRWCDCGFYCFSDPAAARELACAPEHQGAVLLEVVVSGRYRRYELGLRYSRQRVRTVRLRRCLCGRAVSALADTGSGSTGWRRLEPVCVACAGDRPVLDPSEFARLAGDVELGADEIPAGPVAPLRALATVAPPAWRSGSGALPPAGVPTSSEAGAVAVLSAEVALLQARLDEMQERIDVLESGHDGHEPDAGDDPGR